MKKLLSILICACLVFTGQAHILAASEEAIVYVTVTDIRDVDNPFNVLVPRRELTVSEFDIEEKYGESGITFTGIECISGITYMHAIVKLHEELYGESLVTQNLALNMYGETSWFMGTAVDSIMYQNGEDIYSLPQKVNIKNGDEINICLFNVGDEQRVATFTSSKLDVVAVGEEVTLGLYEHLESPQEKTPISNQIITDSDGIYITDRKGDLIRTNNKGQFTMSFDKPGIYQISILPEINYFFKDIGSGERTLTGYSLEEGSETKEIATAEPNIIYNISELRELQNQGITIEALDIYDAYIVEANEDLCENLAYFVWDDDVIESGDSTATVSYSTWSLRRLYGSNEQGEAYPQITYTVPFCTINVTDELAIKSVDFAFGGEGVYDNIWVKFVNANTYEPGAEVVVAAYSEDNTFLNVYRQNIQDNVTFSIETGAAYYKVMIWDSVNSMKPLFNATRIQ